MTDDPHSPPASDSATRGPLSGTALADLFFRPRWFFQSVNLAQGRAWLVAIWIVAMSGTIDRIDRNLVQADLGRARPAWGTVAPMLTGSWASFWTFVVLIGAPSAVFIGVRTRFAVRPGPARVWFLILPLLVYAIVIGVIGMLYALLTPDAPSVTV